MTDEHTMQDLIERLEKATGPDRELDGRIWAEIDGRDVRVAYCEWWKLDGLLAKSRKGHRDECVVGVFGKDGKFLTVGQSNPPADYTASIDAALTLVPEGMDFYFETEQVMGGFCNYVFVGGGGAVAPIRLQHRAGRHHETWTEAKAALPRDISAAALKARMHSDQKNAPVTDEGNNG